MFERMLHNDFSKVKQLQLNGIGNIEEISREEKKFLKILETGTKKNGNHYQVPLPFKDTDVKLPNNINQAVRRKSERKANNGGLWYLPHHGIRHPNKTGSVRFVSDHTANFGGASLNNKLLSGLDLTNKLAGVLLRFKSEGVAFMGDIETIFYQTQVPDNERGFLRYLWSENNHRG